MKNWKEIVEESEERLEDNTDYELLQLKNDINFNGFISGVSLFLAIIFNICSIKHIVFLGGTIICSIFVICALINLNRSKDFIYKIHEEEKRGLGKK